MDGEKDTPTECTIVCLHTPPVFELQYNIKLGQSRDKTLDDLGMRLCAPRASTIGPVCQAKLCVLARFPAAPNARNLPRSASTPFRHQVLETVLVEGVDGLKFTDNRHETNERRAPLATSFPE